MSTLLQAMIGFGLFFIAAAIAVIILLASIIAVLGNKSIDRSTKRRRIKSMFVFLVLIIMIVVWLIIGIETSTPMIN